MQKNSIKNFEIMSQIYQPNLGDRVQLRKKHACGAYTWQVIRIGADIGLLCEECSRKILLPRHIFRRRVKQVLAPKKTEH